MTDHQFNRLLGHLIGIEHELKHISEELHEYNKRETQKDAPPAYGASLRERAKRRAETHAGVYDPMGYTE